MKWRGISEEEVEQTIKNPNEIEDTGKGRKNVFKSIGKRYIKVAYKKLEKEILVITAVDKSD